MWSGASADDPVYLRQPFSDGSIGDPVQLSPTPIGDPVQLFRDPGELHPDEDTKLRTSAKALAVDEPIVGWQNMAAAWQNLAGDAP